MNGWKGVSGDGGGGGRTKKVRNATSVINKKRDRTVDKMG